MATITAMRLPARHRFWYLATPYAKYPGGQDAAFSAAVENASLLAAADIPIFCPIAHSHHMRLHILPADPHNFWLKFDRPFMEAAQGLIICMLPGWRSSVGIEEEEQYFTIAGKPIVHMTPGSIPPEL